MNFGRLPFQFNPTERQAELRKRFGLSKPCDMHIDFGSLSDMGFGNRETGSATSSPRFQHRVPIFVEGPNSWFSEKSQSNNVDSGRKPNVRVVPIEIEGDLKPTRHRTFSGPAGVQQNYSRDASVQNDTLSMMPSIHNMTLPNRKRVPSGETKPCVYNIPISIEKRENSNNIKNDSYKKPNLSALFKDKNITNGCNSGSPITDIKVEEKSPEPEFKFQLKKVESILEELKSYETGIVNFSGVVNDKQYRYLDEMLTRLMLRLDDIETMGNAEVRNARKAAIKKVQSSIDLLETKIGQNIKGDAIITESSDAEPISNEDKMAESSSSEEAEDIPHAIEENANNYEGSEMEQVDETEGIKIGDEKEDLKDHFCAVDEISQILKVSEIDMESEKENNEVVSSSDIENSELLRGTESNVCESSLPEERDSVLNFEAIKSCDSDSKITNETRQSNNSCQIETNSTDSDMAEPLDTSNIDLVSEEACTENSVERNCDIVINENNLESTLNYSKVVMPKITNLYIPENASDTEMELSESSSVTENSLNMPCYESHTVTVSDLDSQPLNLDSVNPDVELVNSSEENSIKIDSSAVESLKKSE